MVCASILLSDTVQQWVYRAYAGEVHAAYHHSATSGLCPGVCLAQLGGAVSQCGWRATNHDRYTALVNLIGLAVEAGLDLYLDAGLAHPDEQYQPVSVLARAMG